MKKIFYSLIVLTVFLVACSTSDENASLTSGSLSESIKSYISNNYPDVIIDQITTNGTTATATLSSGEELTFTAAGSVISYANNACNGLSADSLTISADTTSTDTTAVGHKHHHGKNTQGNKQGKNKPGNGGKKHHNNDVNIDSLSISINDYISANYAGFSVIHASSDTICEGIVTNVMVCDSVSEPVKLVFNADGVFLMSSTRISYNDIPESVKTVVSSDFSTFTPSTRCSLYILADGTLQYKVYLKAEKKIYWVRFTADGTVVCQKL